MFRNLLTTLGIMKEIPKPLGRWSIDKCNSSVNMVNYYSNIDHCGTCDYQREMIEKILEQKNNKETHSE